MKRMLRQAADGKAALLWAALALAATPAFAQNFSGIVATETLAHEDSGEDRAAWAQETPEPVLMGADFGAEEYSTEGTDGVPDFIAQQSHYTLGVEDVIEVAVQRHPEVSGTFVINGEGNIQYQFIGDIRVEGLKKDQVKGLLTERLSEYIITPDVTVKIVGYNSKIVYVIGEVGSPGKIFMRGDTITVREALVQAGLPLLSAKAAQSRLITPSATGRVVKKIVNIQKLLYEGDLRENLIMKPGDTLYVPPTILAKTMRVLQPVAQPIGTAAGTGRTVMTGF